MSEISINGELHLVDKDGNNTLLLPETYSSLVSVNDINEYTSSNNLDNIQKVAEKLGDDMYELQHVEKFDKPNNWGNAGDIAFSDGNYGILWKTLTEVNKI